MTFETVSWTEFKAFVDNRLLSIQYREDSTFVYCKAADGWFALQCNLHKVDDLTSYDEFVASYQPSANQQVRDNVQTVFETNDKTLKAASGAADFDVNGDAVITFTVPGTPGTGDGRWISEGGVWIVEQHKDDRVYEIQIVDTLDLLGYGAGTVIRTYHDEEIADTQKGWRIPYKRGQAEAETIGGYGFIPAGFDLVVKFKRGGGLTTGTAYCNLLWGKTEV